MIRRIAVFGLGKLGACIAAAFARRGFEVVGYDVDLCKVDALARGDAPVDEPKLAQTIREAGGRLRAASDVSEAVAQTDAAFFVPATPSLPDGSFSNQYLVEALRAVAKKGRDQNKRHYLFVVNSTVTPGSSDGVFKPLLEGILRGRCGEDFGLCYNPEFIALGDVIRGLLEPDFVLIGESDPHSGELLEDAYRRFCTNSPPIERMSNINAELAKISVNSAVTTKISFVNQLSAICGRIPGADPGVILQAVGNDHRIGHGYLKPGLGYGGPCFPRDNRLLRYTAQSVGVEALLAEASDRINEQVNRRLLETVLAHAPRGAAVAVLGLAYKPFTSLIDSSPGVWLCRQLAERNHQVYAHDFAAAANASAVLPNGPVRICTDPLQLLENSCRMFVITCPWPAYKELFQSQAAQALKPGTVIVDPWSLLGEVASRLKTLSLITNLE